MYSKRHPDIIYSGKPDPKPKASTMTVRKATPEELAEIQRMIDEKYKYSPVGQKRGVGHLTWKRTKKEDDEEKETENAKMAGEVSLADEDNGDEDDYGDGNEEK